MMMVVMMAMMVMMAMVMVMVMDFEGFFFYSYVFFSPIKEVPNHIYNIFYQCVVHIIYATPDHHQLIISMAWKLELHDTARLHPNKKEYEVRVPLEGVQ